MSYTIVIFGASGDLTSRKLVPALYELHRKGRLDGPTRIVGFSRTPFTHDAWRAKLAESTAKFVGSGFDRAVWDAFATSLFYHAGDLDRPESLAELGELLDELEGAGDHARIYYLAIAPQFYQPAVVALGKAGMTEESRGPRRIVIEKPFGSDLASAKQLNQVVHQVVSESQVYRIDHYLGKETVQNLLVLRFGNAIFEPIWNRNYVDWVEITAAEEVAVGHRGGYYDTAGGAARHVPEPPPATVGPHGHGGPLAVRGRLHPRREGQGLPRHPADAARGRRRRHPPRPPTAGIGTNPAWRPAAARPPSRRSSCWSTTGDGRACRSSSAAAR